MTNDEDDPKNELAARFDERAATDSQTSSSEDTENTSKTDTSSSTSNTNNSGNTGSAESKSPGPDPDPDASRNRERIYMAIGSDRAEALNDMYDRFDARSKLADEGGLEKHRDFWVGVADFVLDHEDELADQLDIPDID